MQSFSFLVASFSCFAFAIGYPQSSTPGSTAASKPGCDKAEFESMVDAAVAELYPMDIAAVLRQIQDPAARRIFQAATEEVVAQWLIINATKDLDKMAVVNLKLISPNVYAFLACTVGLGPACTQQTITAGIQELMGQNSANADPSQMAAAIKQHSNMVMMTLIAHEAKQLYGAFASATANAIQMNLDNRSIGQSAKANLQNMVPKTMRVVNCVHVPVV